MKREIRKKFGKTVYAYRHGGGKRYFANDTSAFVPEIWAQEGVEILNEEMMFAGLVHRDFEDEIASFGDTVNTRIPTALLAERKQNDLDTLNDQNVSATNIPVVLNQRLYVSFMLGDRERSMSFQNLVDIYLREAMVAQARFIDQALAGQVYQFLAYNAGSLASVSSSNANDYMLSLRKVMNDNKVSMDGRWLGLASNTETACQKTDMFKRQDAIGEGSRAIRDAYLGRLNGFNTFLSLNLPSISSVTTATTTTTTAAVAAGASVIPVTAATNLPNGAYFTVAGDLFPHRVLSTATLNLTVETPFRSALSSGAVITPVATGLINQASPIAAGDNTAAVSTGYPANWQKSIVVDGTGVPQAGQLVSFKTSGGTVQLAKYRIVQKLSATEFVLDRPLEEAIDDNAIVCYGPAGDYNFAFQRGAMALVNRPMELPPSGSGARGAYGVANNTSIRAVLSYDSAKQGTRVTIDGLFGIKVLNALRGAVMLG